MSATTSAAPPPASASEERASWRPELSRIVLRRPKGNRRVASTVRRLPAAKQVLDACGRALRRSAPALVGLAVVCAFSAAAAGSYRWLTTSSRFQIAAIELRGNQTLAETSLLELLPVQVGDNIFSVAARAVERALAQSPWIAAVSVRRELPHRLVVTVSERQAAALVELGGLYLVEADGRPFKRAALESGEADGLPVISGLERLAFREDPQATSEVIRAALAALAKWRAVPGRPEVAEVMLDGFRGVTLRLAAPAVALHLGAIDAPDLSDQMALFSPAWRALSDEERARVRALHLDAGPGQATVAFAKD